MGIPERTIELRAYSETGQGRQWTYPLEIVADVEQTRRKRPNKASITVQGLSAESAAFITGAEVVEVVSSEGLLYRGNPRRVRRAWKMPDSETEIACKDGGRLYRDASLTRSYAPGVTSRTVLADLTASIGAGLEILGTLPEQVYESGYCAAGKVRDIITDVVESLDCAWSIQDGVVQILALGAPSTGGALLKAGSGLVGSPEVTDKGIALKALLMPRLRPGRLFRLESRSLTGWYRVTKCQHKAGSRGDPWETAVDAVEAG